MRYLDIPDAHSSIHTSGAELGALVSSSLQHQYLAEIVAVMSKERSEWPLLFLIPSTPHYLILFLCRVFRSLSVDWVSEARRSRFWKRSLALMPFWVVCLGTSNLPPNVRLDLAPSYTNSTGKQSWPCRSVDEVLVQWLRELLWRSDLSQTSFQ